MGLTSTLSSRIAKPIGYSLLSLQKVRAVVVSITGTRRQTQTLTADTSDYSGSPSFSYQWNRDGLPIDGETSSTYTLAADDVGEYITVSVTVDGITTISLAAGPIVAAGIGTMAIGSTFTVVS